MACSFLLHWYFEELCWLASGEVNNLELRSARFSMDVRWFLCIRSLKPLSDLPIACSVLDNAVALINDDDSLCLVSGISGLCKASQIVEVFPTDSPEIVVREARVEDCWEVAETHCSSFFPEYSFPLDFVLRIDRLVGLLAGFSVPNGRHRVCLVAITGCSANKGFLFGNEDIRIDGFDGRFSLNKGYVAGILTVDTVADFLPRKGSLRQRRTGIAYISNVAVREGFRRKGVAKRLMVKAEAQARSWGCRTVALHCDADNPGATKLYKGQGFKSIKVPEGANWPQPETSPDIRFNFMMKLL